jgi:outer membrane biosynthesis protein TonB
MKAKPPEELPIVKDVQEYKIAVALKVAQNWAYKYEGKAEDTAPEALITVTILRSGEIKNITFVKKADDPTLNETARAAIIKSSPFRPFPDNFVENEIDVGIRATPILPQ